MFKNKLVLFMSLVIISTAFGGTKWTDNGKSAEYPRSLYFVGVGLSERGVNYAKQNAMVEVKRQISVNVKSTVTDEQTSSSINGAETYSSKSASRARLESEGEVEGIEIVETTKKNGLFYALAVLDKKKFVSNTKARLAELKENINKLVTEAKKDIASAKSGLALKKLSEAKKLITKFLDQRKLLSAATSITNAEKLDITKTDISLLTEKCVTAIKVKKNSGDKQKIKVGMVPEEPFIINITADGMPVSGIFVQLKNDDNKIVAEKFSDENGNVEFILGSEAETSVGDHEYTTHLKLKVASSLKRVLKATDKTFSYEVESNPCFAKIEVEVPNVLRANSKTITSKVKKRLAKYDIKEDPEADYTIKFSLDVKETGRVQGVSRARTFIKCEVTANIALLEDKKEIISFDKKAKGTGSTLAKSATKAISIMKLKKDAKKMMETLCGSSSDMPMKKIAVFRFKSSGIYTNWYDISQGISDMITTKLINKRKFAVVERSQMDKLMDEKKLGMVGLTEQTEAMSVAKLAGADYIMVGTATLVNNKLEVDARIIDVATGVAKIAMSSTGYGLDNLRELANDVVKKIKMSKIK